MLRREPFNRRIEGRRRASLFHAVVLGFPNVGPRMQWALTKEEMKNCVWLKPESTAPLALSSSGRRDLEHFARHRPLRRPSQPKQNWDFHQPERRLTTRRGWRYSSDQKKRLFKFPIRLAAGAREDRSFSVPRRYAV